MLIEWKIVTERNISKSNNKITHNFTIQRQLLLILNFLSFDQNIGFDCMKWCIDTQNGNFCQKINWGHFSSIQFGFNNLQA